MTFTSCCSISSSNNREKLGRLWGKLSSSGRQKQFQTYPNSDSRLPFSGCALSQLRPHQLPPHVPSTFRFHHRITCDYAIHRSHPAPIASPALQRADPSRLTRRFRQRHRRKSYRPPERSSRFAFVPRLFRSISLADFRPDRPRTDAVRIVRPTWNRSSRPAPRHAATAPNPSKTPTVSLSSAKE